MNRDWYFKMMRSFTLSFCAGLILLTGTACNEKASFRLASFTQEGRRDVRLNERLIFTFTHEVDRSSLSHRAINIRDDSGHPVEGEWEVRGKELHFAPRLPRRADVADSGLSPGRHYSIEFSGFPDLSALRSTEGHLLDRGFSRSFSTVPGAGAPLDRFVDPAPEGGPLLVAVAGKSFHALDMVEVVGVAPGGELTLTFSEPIFPPSVLGGDSGLHLINLEGTVNPDSNPLRLECRYGADLQTVRIGPQGGFQAGRKYKLFRSYLAFTDFGGNPIEAKQFNYISIACRPD
jgi:hypothetical protein